MLWAWAIGCQRSRVDLTAKAQPSVVSAPVEAETSARSLCEALHSVSTDRKAACCGRPPERILLDECVRWVSGSLRSGNVIVNEAQVDACRKATQKSLAGCDWVTPGRVPSVAECNGLLTGKLGEGAACRSSLECRAPLHCDGAAVASTGTCKAPRELGAACSASVDPLASYVLEPKVDESHPLCRDFCSLVSHRCEAVPEPGAACVASANCAPGQHCVTGHCSDATPRGAGESCIDAPCGEGLRCEKQHCAALARTGEACEKDLDCATGGCVSRDGAARVCGMQCSVAPGAMSRGTAQAMRLPLRPLPTAAK